MTISLQSESVTFSITNRQIYMRYTDVSAKAINIVLSDVQYIESAPITDNRTEHDYNYLRTLTLEHSQFPLHAYISELNKRSCNLETMQAQTHAGVSQTPSSVLQGAVLSQFIYSLGRVHKTYECRRSAHGEYCQRPYGAAWAHEVVGLEWIGLCQHGKRPYLLWRRRNRYSVRVNRTRCEWVSSL